MQNPDYHSLPSHSTCSNLLYLGPQTVIRFAVHPAASNLLYVLFAPMASLIATHASKLASHAKQAASIAYTCGLLPAQDSDLFCVTVCSRSSMCSHTHFEDGFSISEWLANGDPTSILAQDVGMSSTWKVLVLHESYEVWQARCRTSLRR